MATYLHSQLVPVHEVANLSNDCFTEAAQETHGQWGQASNLGSRFTGGRTNSGLDLTTQLMLSTEITTLIPCTSMPMDK